MRFSIQRAALLRRLQQVVGVVERRQTLPVLANLLVNVDSGGVALTGTDLEVEMVARTEADDLDPGEVTVPARKLFDIVRALPDGVTIKFDQSGERAVVSAGRSRFTLATLPAHNCAAVAGTTTWRRCSARASRRRPVASHTAWSACSPRASLRRRWPNRRVCWCFRATIPARRCGWRATYARLAGTPRLSCALATPPPHAGWQSARATWPSRRRPVRGWS